MAATWLAEALRADGLPVIEHAGWQQHGTGGLFTPIGVLVHHTAGPAAGDLPSFGIVRNGRAGLPGPLSQLMLSRSGEFHVLAAGRANHAGVGYAAWVPNQDGNRYLIGIEAESCGTRDDWTPEQRANYPRGVAALCRWMRVNETRVLGHKEWAPTRKIDPAFWDMNAFRAQVRAHLNSEDDVLSDADKKWMFDTFARRVDVGFALDNMINAVGHDPATFIRDRSKFTPQERAALALARRVDVGYALEKTVAALAGLVARGANDLTADQVKAAVAEAIAQSVNFDVTMTPKPE